MGKVQFCVDGRWHDGAVALRDAEKQLDDTPEKVVCDCCGDVSKLEIIDNSIGHGHYRYDIVTECCNSSFAGLGEV